MADQQNNVVDGRGNLIRLDNTGIVIEAAPGLDIQLETSGGGFATLNGADIATDGGSAVSSVFGRTGAVVAGPEDYAAVAGLELGSTTGASLGFDEESTGAFLLENSAGTVYFASDVPGAGDSQLALASGVLFQSTPSGVTLSGANLFIPTPATNDNSTKAATTTFVKAQNYAPIASPALTGTPTVPTASAGTNTTQAASTAFVQTSVAANFPAVKVHTSALNQSGGFTANLLTSPTPGLYRINFYILQTSGSGTVTAQVNFHDDTGAVSLSDPNAGKAMPESFVAFFEVASGNITYTMTLIGAATFSVYVVVERLN